MKSFVSKITCGVLLVTNLSAHGQTFNAPNRSALQQKSTASQLNKSSMGGVVSGGGDLCENRIKTIRDDLKKWISENGAYSADFVLPHGISKAQYSQAMIGQIDSVKIRCVGKDDDGYPVQINGTPKVCRFDVFDNHSEITCDIAKFQTFSESDQYVLIHHEYAGLAEVETPNADDSVYVVSNQISEYLVDTVVKRLAVKPSSRNSYACFKNGDQTFRCSEEQVLKAFRQLQDAEKSEGRGASSMTKTAGKILFAAGAVTFAISVVSARTEGRSYAAGIIARTCVEISKSLFGYTGGIGGIIAGAGAMIFGGAIMMLSPSDIADGTLTGYLASDSGTRDLLKLSDEEFLGLARKDERVSLRVMQIHSAIASIEMGAAK